MSEETPAQKAAREAAERRAASIRQPDANPDVRHGKIVDIGPRLRIETARPGLWVVYTREDGDSPWWPVDHFEGDEAGATAFAKTGA